MKLGFTGSQTEPSEKQGDWLVEQIRTADELHHGACVGGDALAHFMAVLWDVPVVVHPPSNESRVDERVFEHGPDDRVDYREPKEYLLRNRDIVNETDELVALPSGPERLRSGTWSTVRYAVKLGRTVTICYPDGSIEIRNPVIRKGA
jgi:hypothetical protein